MLGDFTPMTTEITGGRILEVRCHDSYINYKIDSDFKAGVDLEPIRADPFTKLIKADGRFPPLKNESFDLVLALDVIEHVQEDHKLVSALVDLLVPGGKLILTTPSHRIQMFPSFLTKWISNSQGHEVRKGYSQEELAKLFDRRVDIRISQWNAPFYRLLYLPLAAINRVFPGLVKYFIRPIAQWDFNHQDGPNDFLTLEGCKSVLDGSWKVSQNVKP